MGKFVGKKVHFGSFLVVLWFRTVVNYRNFSVFSESKLNFQRRKNLNGIHYGVEFRIGDTIQLVNQHFPKPTIIEVENKQNPSEIANNV